MTTRPKQRRSGRWEYGEHPGLNPGWRLLGTPLVLDFDPSNYSCAVPGCYVLWRDGTSRAPVDHYLDGAMEYVESHLDECLSGGRP